MTAAATEALVEPAAAEIAAAREAWARCGWGSDPVAAADFRRLTGASPSEVVALVAGDPAPATTVERAREAMAAWEARGRGMGLPPCRERPWAPASAV